MTTFFYFFMLLSSIAFTDISEKPSEQVTAPTVDAGDDVVICNPGQSVTLTATTSPDVIYYEWSPVQFLSNPFQQSVLATVGATTTFTVTVGSPPVVNLFGNGDFADPDFNSYFSTDYFPPSGGANGPLTEPGQLVITPDANSQNIDYSTIGDLTGEGNMLVVNGIAQGFNVLCQQIPVTPNTIYQFQGFAAAVITESPAVVQVFINGVALQSAEVPVPPGAWVPFGGIWNSGGVTNATICIQDLNNVGIGNDFALDNISFGPLCVASDQVSVIIPQLDASFDTPDTLCVTEFPITLDDYLEPSATPGGSWFVDGTPDFFFDPAVLGEGLHTVTYSVEVPPCMEESSQNIFIVPPPESEWDNPGDLCISDPTIDLNDLLSPNTEPGGFWNVNGLPATLFDPEDLGPGQHVVIYTAGDLQTGCTSDTRDTIEVFPRTIASWNNPSPICEEDSPLILDSLLNPNATPGGTWTVNGIDTNIVYPSELGAGDVIVSYSVSNPACDSTQTDTLAIIGALAAAFSVSEDTICLGTTLNVTFTGTANDSTQYFWDFGGGNILSGTGAGPYDIDFSGSGVYNISLWLEEASCTSDTVNTMITVVDPLPAPQPVCASIENSSLTFSWPSIPGAVNYSVSVLTGQTGGLLMDTSFTIGGLMPNELVQIIVTAEGNAPCQPVASATIDCTTLDCIVPDVTIADIPSSCMDTANVLPFPLIVNVNPDSGVGAWSGPGIIDTALGIFDPIMAGVGTHIITYEYEVNNCSNQDTALAVVYPLPIASFTAADSICIGDTTLLSFDGVIQNTADYTWNLDGGISLSAANNPDQQVYWTTAGMKIISLQVEENGCSSAIYEDTIEVSPLLEIPVVLCTPTETAVTYSWNNQIGVDNYVVNVLSGQSGMMTSDTSFLIDGLTPGTDVNISVLAESATPCPDVIVEQACQAVACDSLTIDIDPISDICLDPNLADIPLSVTISDGNISGTYTWSGNGIIDDTLGVFSPQDAQIGENIISVTYQRGFCFYNASTTITVYETPTSDFSIQPDTICVTDQLLVTYTGNASDTATYNWNFDGGNAIPGTGVGPHDIDWSMTGTYAMSLWVEENACISDTLTQMLEVEPLLDTTTINCESTYTSVLFSWENITNVDVYQINVVQGPIGTMVADTAYLITGLQPDEEVMITLDVISSNSCPSYQLSQTCSTLPCPDVSLNINPLPFQCFDGTADTLDLSVVVVNDTGNGTLTWDGVGIIDPNQPLWVTDASQVGQSNMLIATWTEDVCVFSDTVMLEVFATPIADFVHDSLICELDTASISFTGSINSIGTSFNWDFSGGTLISGNDAGPLQVQWAAPGTYPISLFIIDNGCVSDTITSDIVVDPVLESPQINCEATTSTITFSWEPVANASAYQVDVLSGMSGVQTSDTSYVVSGLNAMESVSIQVTAISNNACPSSTVTETCMTSNCPPVTVDIGAVADQCFDGTPDTLDLTVVVTNDTGNGLITWTGAGIIDPNQPLWVTDASQIGQSNMIIATWTEDVCVFSDTVMLEVFATPIADFVHDSLICELDTATINFSGMISSIAPTFNWDFSGGTLISGNDAGPLQVQWSAPGTYPISLFITENGCTSDTVSSDIIVDPELESPQVSCEATTSTITFSWEAVANASAYQVDVLSGMSGVQTSDTSYVVSGLNAMESVSIQVTAISNNACPSSTVTETCMTSNCPPVTVEIGAIADQCFDGTPDSLDLTVVVTNDTGNGTITWSGAGITDPDEPLWITAANQIGQNNEVIVTWVDDVCSFSDTLTFNVFETPVASFDLPAIACVSDTVLVTFTGNASNAASYNWDFDGAVIISGTDEGPYELQWPSAGNPTISLWIEDNGCISDTVSQAILLDPVLAMPIVSCESTFSSILFTWSPVANASSYLVDIDPGLPMGTFLADTAYLISGLEADMMVDILVTATSTNECPGVSTSVSCMTLSCPDLTLDILPIPDQCYDGTSDTIMLEVAITGDIGNGQISWQGDGIIQADTGLWEINAAQVGQMNQVIVNWQDDICLVSDTAFINVFETPDNAFSVDSAICVLEVATVMYEGNAANTAIFNWDFDGGTVISGSGVGPYEIQWPLAGTYTISLEVVENGCSSGTSQQTIIVDPELEMVQIDCESFLSAVEFSWNTIANASGYEVTVLNGGPMGTFLNDTTYRIENLDPQEMVSISVTAISDNFCPGVSVEADCMTSTCPNVLIDLNAAATICEGDEVIFEILFSGDQSGPYNLTYTLGGVPTMLNNVSSDVQLSLNPAITTTFEITAIEDLGAPTCPPTLPMPITTVVNTPVDAGNSAMPLSICSATDTTVTLSDFLIGADAGGIWTYVSGPVLQAGNFNDVNGTFNLLTQEAGIYTFNYALTALPPCSDDNTEVQIIIEERPVADAGNDATLSCGQNEVMLGGANTSTGPNISYSWTSDNGLPITNPNQATITVTQPGNYTLLVTNTASGCSESSTIFVDLDESFLLPFASLTDISCFSANDGGISIDSVNGGTPPYLYAINGAAFTESNVFMGLLPGNYEVLIEDATGCQSTLSFDLTEPGELTVALTANFEGNENEITLGESLTLTANVSIPASEIETIAWQPDSVACDSCLVNTFTPTETSIYSVTIVDVNGCNAFDEMMIFVNREDGVYLPTAFSPNGDGRNDLFTLFTGPQVAEIRVFQIFDRWGEKIHDLQDMMPNDPLLGWDGSFRGEPMNPGVYVYMAEVILIDGTEQVITGDVVLLR